MQICERGPRRGAIAKAQPAQGTDTSRDEPWELLGGEKCQPQGRCLDTGIQRELGRGRSSPAGSRNRESMGEAALKLSIPKREALFAINPGNIQSTPPFSAPPQAA